MCDGDADVGWCMQELQQQAPLRPLTGDKFEACVVCADRASGTFTEFSSSLKI